MVFDPQMLKTPRPSALQHASQNTMEDMQALYMYALERFYFKECFHDHSSRNNLKVCTSVKIIQLFTSSSILYIQFDPFSVLLHFSKYVSTLSTSSRKKDAYYEPAHYMRRPIHPEVA